MSNQLSGQGFFGRYRRLMFTIALFLLSDAAVVSLTLHFAQQSVDYSAALNSSKRVRELTLELQRQAAEINILSLRQLEVPKEFIAELDLLADELVAVITRLDQGGPIIQAGGAEVMLKPLEKPELRAALASTRNQFAAIQNAIASLKANPEVRAVDVAYLYSYMERFYYRSEPEVVTLLSQVQAQANEAAERLRITQIVGLLIALCNFLYTALITMRALVRNDGLLAAARRDTDEILANVSDGLLLLDADLKIGATTSAALPKILQRELSHGDDFLDVLGEIAAPETRQASASYLKMLVEGRVRENLVKSLNPLSEVELGQAGSHDNRHLSFQFARVFDQKGQFSHLLVTVQDATRRVQLARELRDARQKTRAELEVYLRLLGKDADALRDFVDHTRTRIGEINSRMRAATQRRDSNYGDVVRAIFQQVHSIKGDALGLGLDFFAELTQRFEDELQALRSRPGLGGDDFLDLSVRLDEMFERLGVLGSIVDRLGGATVPATAPPAGSRLDRIASALDELAASTAQRRGKQVRLVADLRALAHFSEDRLRELGEIVVQLVRNAVVHGIETPDQRRQQQKQEVGTVLVVATRARDDKIELRVRDDGAGIDPEAIRARLVASGRHSSAAAAALDDQQLVRWLFEPGVSTIEHADQDAGRGVGLDLVRERLTRLGCSARVSSQLRQFTEFAFRLGGEASPRLAEEENT